MNRTDLSAACIVVIAAIVLLFMIGRQAGRSQERQRAVDADVAEWYATQDGKVEFRYKTGEKNVGQAK